MAIFYFYCDESGKYRKNPVITVSGIGATKPHLDTFFDDWTALLRSYELGDELHMSRVSQLSQACGPKMPSGQSIDERIGALIPFADCINHHFEIGLIQAWDIKGYNHLSLEAKRNLGGSHDPYQLAFVRGLLGIAHYIGEDGRFSVIADDDDQTAWDTYIHYRAISAAIPELAKQLAALTFAKSQYFPALQAADMVAFLSRREASARFYGKTNEFKPLLDYLATDPSPSAGIMRWFTLFADEAQLINFANDMNKITKAGEGI